MVTYLSRRIAGSAVVALVATFAIFTLVALSTNPLGRLATCTTCDPAAFEALTAKYNLDQPIPVRFISWLSALFHGDLGTSISFGDAPVGGILGERLFATTILAIPAFIGAVIVSLVIGLLAAIHRGGWIDRLPMAGSLIVIAVPSFVIALGLQAFWGVWWPNWTGTKPFRISGVAGDSLGDFLYASILPTLCLVMVLSAVEFRFVRTAVIDTEDADYVRSARARGVPARTVLTRHRLRNAMIPIVTVWALDFAILMGGAVVTEVVFNWPGLGSAYLASILGSDINLVMGISLVVIIATISFNLVVDVLYGVLDPRVTR